MGVWSYIVDDQGDSRNVDTTGENVGGDENLRFAASERIDDSIALGTLDTTGQRSDGVTFSMHPLLNSGSGLASLVKASAGRLHHQRSGDTHLDENDGRANGEQSIQVDKTFEFLVIIAAV